MKKLDNHVVIPPSIIGEAGDLFQNFIFEASKTYHKLVEEGVSREDARFVIPNAAETSLLMTIDGKSLMHFFGLRLCNRAQWEIRALANEMLLRVKEVESELFKNTGPYCIQLGYCSEGRFTCGKIGEMKERFVLKN
jgi:thymidylate synthase (FAD)